MVYLLCLKLSSHGTKHTTSCVKHEMFEPGHVLTVIVKGSLLFIGDVSVDRMGTINSQVYITVLFTHTQLVNKYVIINTFMGVHYFNNTPCMSM